MAANINVIAQFKVSVLARDNHICKKCGQSAVEAHRIIEDLPNGGYVIDNGISLCLICNKLAKKFHASKGKDWAAGFHPSELFKLIKSSYEIAYNATLKIRG